MNPDNRQLLAGLVPLVLISITCGVLLTQAHRCTRDGIEAQRQQLALRVIGEVLPMDYDNDLLHDRIEINDPAYFRGRISAYRARYRGQAVGIALLPVSARGYKGTIELALGLSRDGVITGVRVTRQQETEGLGDRIDQHKSRWILGFTGHSLANTPAGDWAVHSDGGDFDQLSGATISPRGVINAVKKTLEYYDANREQLLRMPGSDPEKQLINKG